MALFQLAKASCSSLRLPTGVVMLRQSLFGSIGWALPAAGGACRAAAAIVGPGMGGPGAGRRRVVVATGDGSLQMTAQALGPMLRDRLAPVVLLVDNGGYLIERLLCSRPFAVYNEVPAWDHELLPLALGGAAGSVAVVSASSRGQLAGFVTGVADAQAGGRLAWGVLHTPRDSFPSGSAAIGPGARIMAAGVVGGPL